MCTIYSKKKVKIRYTAESRLHNRPKRTAGFGSLIFEYRFLFTVLIIKLFFSILGEITVKGEKGERGLRVSKYIIIDVML
jgi:hypothetical protein